MLLVAFYYPARNAGWNGTGVCRGRARRKGGILLHRISYQIWIDIG